MYKHWYKLFFKLYWKSLFMLLWPFAILPIPLIWRSEATRCLYVLMWMVGYWVTECIPLAVTGLFPMILFPTLAILDTNSTALAYMCSANIIFIAGYMMAISIEYSGLNVRIALNWILLVGTSHRKLHMGLALITMFISMWIVNTAATAMMIPIIDACLQELERNDLGEMYVYPENRANLTEEEVEEMKVPSSITMNYFLTSAYASTIGGSGTLVGTAANLAFKGLYEESFPNDEITFTKFTAFTIVPMLINTVLSWLWFEIYFMGLFRPKSKVAILVKKAKDNENITRDIIKQKAAALGKINFQEVMILVLFVLLILLFVFSDLGFIPGWYDLFPNKRNIKDAVSISAIVIMYLAIPAEPLFIHCWDEDKTKRPKKPSGGLVTWPIVESKIKWGMLFLLGGGFAMEKGMKSSGLANIIGEKLATIAKEVDPLVAQCIFMVSSGMITEMTANVAVCNIMVPIAAEVCKKMKWHPLTLMLPTAICCSYSFMLPASTPPNALVSSHANIPTSQMILAGFIVKIICVPVIIIYWHTVGVILFNAKEAPPWLHSPPPEK